jgi:hypothetical protein
LVSSVIKTIVDFSVAGIAECLEIFGHDGNILNGEQITV